MHVLELSSNPNDRTEDSSFETKDQVALQERDCMVVCTGEKSKGKLEI